MDALRKIKYDLAKSIYLHPCKIGELYERDFLKNTSIYGIDRLVAGLEIEGALFYKEGSMHIERKWAKAYSVLPESEY